VGSEFWHDQLVAIYYGLFTLYNFENGALVKISLNTNTDFEQVKSDFSMRYGPPLKTWNETAQNGNGATFELRNAYWDLPNDASALVEENVTFLMPPDWLRLNNPPAGYVHTTWAVVESKAELEKTKAPEQHVKF